MSKPAKILFVGLIDSPHLARWINSAEGIHGERYLFSAYLAHPHSLLNVRHYTGYLPVPPARDRLNWVCLSPVKPSTVEVVFNHAFKGVAWRARWLELMIRRIKPDIVHSMEFQGAGYLCLEVKQRMGAAFPTWIATNYGSDVLLFGRLAEHRDRVKAILEQADFYSAECQRDMELARAMGLKARPLPVIPNSGGLDLDMAQALRQPGPTSARKVIAIKGYQHFAGRALTALAAVRLAAEHLRGYQIRLFSASPDVAIAAELMAQDTGLDIACLPRASHADMLRLHGSARVSMGINIADGLSTSFVEALAMGSFPIQTNTAAADELITDGVGGFIVPPEDEHLIAERLIRAVSDDALVDRAADSNLTVARDRLDMRKVTGQIRDFYAPVTDYLRQRRG